MTVVKCVTSHITTISDKRGKTRPQVCTDTRLFTTECVITLYHITTCPQSKQHRNRLHKMKPSAVPLAYLIKPPCILRPVHNMRCVAGHATQGDPQIEPSYIRTSPSIVLHCVKTFTQCSQFMQHINLHTLLGEKKVSEKKTSFQVRDGPIKRTETSQGWKTSRKLAFTHQWCCRRPKRTIILTICIMGTSLRVCRADWSIPSFRNPQKEDGNMAYVVVYMKGANLHFIH